MASEERREKAQCAGIVGTGFWQAPAAQSPLSASLVTRLVTTLFREQELSCPVWELGHLFNQGLKASRKVLPHGASATPWSVALTSSRLVKETPLLLPARRSDTTFLYPTCINTVLSPQVSLHAVPFCSNLAPPQPSSQNGTRGEGCQATCG